MDGSTFRSEAIGPRFIGRLKADDLGSSETTDERPATLGLFYGPHQQVILRFAIPRYEPYARHEVNDLDRFVDGHVFGWFCEPDETLQQISLVTFLSSFHICMFLFNSNVFGS